MTRSIRTGKAAEVVLYADADHGFMCEERPSFHPEHVQEAWPRRCRLQADLAVDVTIGTMANGGSPGRFAVGRLRKMIEGGRASSAKAERLPDDNDQPGQGLPKRLKASDFTHRLAADRLRACLVDSRSALAHRSELQAAD